MTCWKNGKTERMFAWAGCFIAFYGTSTTKSNQQILLIESASPKSKVRTRKNWLSFSVQLTERVSSRKLISQIRR